MALLFLKFVVFMIIVGVTTMRALRFETVTDKYGRQHTNTTVNKLPIFIGAGALIFALLLFPAVGFVEAGHRGVVLRFGAVTGRILPEGLYIVSPIIESVKHMDVQVHADASKASASSRDLQIVSTEVTLNYALDPNAVAKVYQDLRYDYATRIIAPAIQEAVKATTAQFDAEQLITQRPKVRDGIQNFLEQRLIRHGIVIDAMSLTDFAFSKEFNDAIEAKVTATQRALQAGNDLDRIRIEAEQRIAQATAEAEAIRIQAKSIADQGGENYVALKWVEKWNGMPPQIMTSGQSGLLFQVPGQSQ